MKTSLFAGSTRRPAKIGSLVDKVRCSSTGRQCDGYSISKDDYQVKVWNVTPPTQLQKTVSVFSQLFGDSIIYLEYYHHSARPMLANDFDNDFWSHMVMQMALSEPSVRHALMALGYLHKTEDGTMKHARSKFAAHHESKIFLHHYSKSVTSLVQRMADRDDSCEVGLATCLLYICIEFLRGNYHTAFTHLRNGLKIVNEQQSCGKRSPVLSMGTSTSLSSPSLESSQAGSSPIHDTVTNYSTSPESPGPTRRISHSSFNELGPLFTRAIACALMYGVNVYEVIDVPMPSISKYKSLCFDNIREVHISSHELRNASILMIMKLMRSLLHIDPETKSRGTIKLEDFARHADLLECQKLWYRALTHFEATHEPPKQDTVALSTMKTHYHAVHIWTHCATEVRQTPFDAHLDGFKQILYHAGLVFDSMESHPKQDVARFTFEISIIPPLYFVATRCRCPITRRKAVDLLARNPPREGLWDAQQHVVVSNRAIEIEEREIDPLTGWPSERTRLHSSVINADMDRNGGFWAYFTFSWGLLEAIPDGEPKVLQEFFTLLVRPKTCSVYTLTAP